MVDEKIRKANMEDCAKILELFNSDSNLIGDDLILHEEKHIIEYLENPCYEMLIYEIDRQIIGIVLMQIMKTAEFIYIEDLIVKEDYRRKGIATKLIKKIEEMAENEKMDLIYLFSEEENLPMHTLIEKLGYKRGKNFCFFSKINKDAKK